MKCPTVNKKEGAVVFIDTNAASIDSKEGSFLKCSRIMINDEDEKYIAKMIKMYQLLKVSKMSESCWESPVSILSQLRSRK
jgi:hypothetical protein